MHASQNAFLVCHKWGGYGLCPAICRHPTNQNPVSCKVC